MTAIPRTADTAGPPGSSATVTGPNPSVAGVPSICLLDGPTPRPLDAFLRRHPAAGLYHTRAWHQALGASGAGHPLVLLATRGDDVTGILPLGLVPGPVGRGRLVSLPATPAAGILAGDCTSAWLLASRAQHLAAARGLDGVWIREFVAHRCLPACVHAATVLDWVRMPLHDLRCVETAPDRPGSAMRVCCGLFGAAESRVLARVDTGVPAAVLRTLADDPPAPLRAAIIDRGGSRQPLGVWTVVARCVHVLACAGHATCPDAFVRVLLAAAHDGAAAGAEWVDFPCPTAPGPRMRALLNSSRVRFACERRLHDADAHLHFLA